MNFSFSDQLHNFEELAEISHNEQNIFEMFYQENEIDGNIDQFLNIDQAENISNQGQAIDMELPDDQFQHLMIQLIQQQQKSFNDYHEEQKQLIEQDPENFTNKQKLNQQQPLYQEYGNFSKHPINFMQQQLQSQKKFIQQQQSQHQILIQEQNKLLQQKLCENLQIIDVQQEQQIQQQTLLQLQEQSIQQQFQQFQQSSSNIHNNNNKYFQQQQLLIINNSNSKQQKQLSSINDNDNKQQQLNIKLDNDNKLQQLSNMHSIEKIIYDDINKQSQSIIYDNINKQQQLQQQQQSQQSKQIINDDNIMQQQQQLQQQQSSQSIIYDISNKQQQQLIIDRNDQQLEQSIINSNQQQQQVQQQQQQNQELQQNQEQQKMILYENNGIIINEYDLQINDYIQYEDRNILNKDNIKIQNTTIVTCTCKKSKCLKMYCECFQAGLFCQAGCRCQDCENVVENLVEVKSQQEQNRKHYKIEHKGCNCRKSNCQKKYCECYQQNIKCTKHCKCIQCKNTTENTDNNYLSDDEQNQSCLKESLRKRILSEAILYEKGRTRSVSFELFEEELNKSKNPSLDSIIEFKLMNRNKIFCVEKNYERNIQM